MNDPEYTAFGRRCPTVEELQLELSELGFRLSFELSASHYTYHAPLPAQRHYEDRTGSHVAVLLGRDIPEDGTRYPAHAARWWIYQGADPAAFSQAKDALAQAFSLTWLLPGEWEPVNKLSATMKETLACIQQRLQTTVGDSARWQALRPRTIQALMARGLLLLEPEPCEQENSVRYQISPKGERVLREMLSPACA